MRNEGRHFKMDLSLSIFVSSSPPHQKHAPPLAPLTTTMERRSSTKAHLLLLFFCCCSCCCWPCMFLARAFQTSSRKAIIHSKGSRTKFYNYNYHTGLSIMAPRAAKEEEATRTTATREPSAVTATRKSPRKRAAAKQAVDAETSAAAPPKKVSKAPKTTKAKAKAITKSPPTTSSPKARAADGEGAETTTKKKKPPSHQVLTERDELPKLWDEEKAQSNGSYTFKIASWNVAGIRALLKKTPRVFSELVQKHDLDVLCLQETKLQEQHLDDPKLKIRDSVLVEDGYDGYWTCSTARKGYAGTAVFVKQRGAASAGKKKPAKQKTMDSFVVGNTQSSKTTKESTKAASLPIDPQLLVPENVSYTMGIDKHDNEGRLVVVEMPLFTFCNVYVPNSGQKLERLTYRTEEWDKDFLAFVQSKQQEQSKPVLWLGDLNVAHTNLEVWNDGAKHLPKQAGVTPQERASFQAQLDAGWIDAFRRLHPTAAGHYSYWSGRAGNREPNKGLRLDYFICDPALFEETSQVLVRDSYMDHEQLGSDHCPVILELEIKKNASA